MLDILKHGELIDVAISWRCLTGLEMARQLASVDDAILGRKGSSLSLQIDKPIGLSI